MSTRNVEGSGMNQSLKEVQRFFPEQFIITHCRGLPQICASGSRIDMLNWLSKFLTSSIIVMASTHPGAK